MTTLVVYLPVDAWSRPMTTLVIYLHVDQYKLSLHSFCIISGIIHTQVGGYGNIYPNGDNWVQKCYEKQINKSFNTCKAIHYIKTDVRDGEIC